MGYHKTSDKRRFLRYEVLDYALVDAGGEPVKAVIVDIGLGGLQLRSKAPLPIGAVCRIHIGQLHTEPIQLRAEVRHSGNLENSDLVASGVRFCPQTHEDKLTIAEYVHGVFQRQCDKLLL